MRAFSMISHLVPDSKQPPTFWPGDDIEVSVLASDDYKEASKTRMEKLRDIVCDKAPSIYFPNLIVDVINVSLRIAPRKLYQVDQV